MIDLIEVRSEVQIADVANLAREIWQEHYVPIIGQEQVDSGGLAKLDSDISVKAAL
jgi:hypothetical protein